MNTDMVDMLFEYKEVAANKIARPAYQLFVDTQPHVPHVIIILAAVFFFLFLACRKWWTIAYLVTRRFLRARRKRRTDATPCVEDTCSWSTNTKEDDEEEGLPPMGGHFHQD